MTEPDFEALRRQRNMMFTQRLKRYAEEEGVPVEEITSTFDPNACFCMCPTGPCEHRWDGPEWRSEDGLACSVTCSRCGSTAMSHDLRTMP